MLGRHRFLFAGLLFSFFVATQAGPLPPDNDYLNAVWVAESDGGLKLAASDGRKLCEIPEWPGAEALAVDERGGVLWVYGGKRLQSFSFGCRLLSDTVVAAKGAQPTVAVNTIDGSVWLGSQKDLFHFTALGRLSTTVTLKEDVRGLVINPKNSHVWVAGIHAATELDELGSVTGKIEFAPNENLRAIEWDATTQELWAAHQNGIVRTGEDGTRTFTASFLSAELLSSDGQGGLWIASQQSVSHFAADGRATADFTPFAPADGAITGVEADLVDGSVWITGHRSLAHFDAEGNLLRRWTGEELGERVSGEQIRALALYSDRIAPDLTVVAPPAGSYVNTSFPEFAFAYSDVGIGVDPDTLKAVNNVGAVALDCQFDEDRANCVPVSARAEGRNTLTFSIKDFAGNESSLVTQEFTIDTVPPTITVTSPLDGAYTNQPSVTLAASVSEWADVTVNGIGIVLNTDNAFSREWPLSEGANSFALTATDRAQNVANATVTVILDTQPPAPAVIGMIHLETNGDGSVTVTGDAASVEAGARVRVTNLRTGEVVEVVADANGRFTATIAAQAGDELSIEVIDAAGNRSSKANMTLPSDEPEPGTGYVPRDPALNAPPLDLTVVTTAFAASEFLFSGSERIQFDVAPGTIEPHRAAVLRGQVLDRDGKALPGVTVTAQNHPEFGWTGTRTDGHFDLVVNGGGVLTVVYEKAGYLPVQRQIASQWGSYGRLPDVVMIGLDPQVTTIDLTSNVPVQAAQGSPVTDKDGTRQATLLFAQGIRASLVMPDGTTKPLTTLNVRATEYTVGEKGHETMPGLLPPTSAYTYAVELSVDEAMAAGAKEVRFDRAVPVYVDNFLNFPVGSDVPAGWYDRSKSAWIASDNGRVVKVLGITGDLAELAVTKGGGAASAATLAALGITDAERRQLASLYAPGTSLWRVPVKHFTPWDYNWPKTVPDDAKPPQVPDPEIDELEDDPCEIGGSIIECENQVLGETIPLTGTPFKLNYRSSRVPGRKGSYTSEISLSGATVPASLKRIELEIAVAGRFFRYSYAPLPKQIHMFVWDGKDAFGREVQGIQPATFKVGYVYPAVYTEADGYQKAFALAGGAPLTADVLRDEITYWQSKEVHLGLHIPALKDLGRWTIDPHHLYDGLNAVLFRGDGSRHYQAGSNLSIASPAVAETFAGNASWGPWGPWRDGVPATETILRTAMDVAVGPDGSVYIAEWETDGRIRRVGGDGIINTVAGGGSNIANAYGWKPATSVRIYRPSGIAIGPDGSLYISHAGDQQCVTRVANGSIRAVVRSACNQNNVGFWGDGKPATEAGLNSPKGIDVGPDGSLYIADSGNNRIRRVDPNGIITTIAGGGKNGLGDGGRATEAELKEPNGVAIGLDGSVYIADTGNNRVRRVLPSGIIHTIAGTGVAGFDGDGGPATKALLNRPLRVTVGADGGINIVGDKVIRWVGPDGIIKTVAGTRALGSQPSGSLATDTSLLNAFGVKFGFDHNFYVADGQVVFKMGPSKPEPAGNGDLLLASPDGSELYVVDPAGRHRRTLDARTNAILYEFGYTANGYLANVTDGDGNTTWLERDTEGNPSAIIAPDGQRTDLAVDANGYLSSVRNPNGDTYRMSYSTGGLLVSFSKPNDSEANKSSSTFVYDEKGLLVRDTNAAEGGVVLERLAQSDGRLVTATSAEGRTDTYRLQYLPDGSKKRSHIGPDGTTRHTATATNGQIAISEPDGTTVEQKLGPDPRFGIGVPVPSKVTITTPSGLVSQTSTYRSATLADGNNPLSHTRLAETVSHNGRASQRVYTASNRTETLKTAGGRLQSSIFDGIGHVIRSQYGNLAPTSFSYDLRGRLTRMTEGDGEAARSVHFGYDPLGNLATVSDDLGRTIGFEYDPAGRVTKQSLPDKRAIGYQYDRNGNLTALTPPGREAHVFAYSPVDLEEAYTPPDLSGVQTVTRYKYNRDKQLTSIERPDGRTVGVGYDVGGRLMTTTIKRGSYQYTYHPTTGQLSSVRAPDGGVLSYVYDGFLPLSETASGAIKGSVSRTYDKNFWVTSLSLNGQAVNFGYDSDGLITSAGDLNLARDPENGLLTGSTLGTVATNRTYNGFGELDTEAATVNGAAVMTTAYTRDTLGRITAKTETVDGVTTIYGYGYDKAGRLEKVFTNGQLTTTYVYDENGNRLSKVTPNGTETGTYDEQDRIVAYGGASYGYTANGELKSKTENGATTHYVYDELGNLIQARLPGDVVIDYIIDGRNRRIGKKVNGKLVQAFLYQDELNPVAELDGSGNVVSRFVYGSKSHVPDYMEKEGKTYRIVSDHLGSPRLIVDVGTSEVVQEIAYDEFGMVLEDTNPGFQPFGFAGGVYDQHTSLVRFGARDFEPRTGHWTAKDPIGFAGGDTSLFAYALHDPINFIDPDGQFVNLVTGAIGAAVGAAVAAATGQSILAGAISGGLSGLFPGGTLLANMVIGAATGLVGTLADPCAGAKDFLINGVAGALGGAAGRQLGLANGLAAARSGASNAVSRAFGAQAASGSIASGYASAGMGRL